MNAITARTSNFIFQHLIFSYCFPISFTFMLLSSKIFHRLIVKETVSMNTTRDLFSNLYIYIIRFCLKSCRKTYDITFVHFASETSAPLCEYNAGRHCNQVIRLRMDKIELVTIRRHGKEYDKGKCPSKDNTERYQSNCDIDKYRDDAEEN